MIFARSLWNLWHRNWDKYKNYAKIIGYNSNEDRKSRVLEFWKLITWKHWKSWITFRSNYFGGTHEISNQIEFIEIEQRELCFWFSYQKTNDQNRDIFLCVWKSVFQTVKTVPKSYQKMAIIRIWKPGQDRVTEQKFGFSMYFL